MHGRHDSACSGLGWLALCDLGSNLLLVREHLHFPIDHAEALVPSRSRLIPRRSPDAGNSWVRRGGGSKISGVCINAATLLLASSQPPAGTGQRFYLLLLLKWRLALVDNLPSPRPRASSNQPHSFPNCCLGTNHSNVLSLTTRIASSSRAFSLPSHLIPARERQYVARGPDSWSTLYDLRDRAVMFNSVPARMYFHCCHFLGLDSLPQAY